MNVLEKILQEIKKLKCNQDSENQDYITGYMSALSTVEGIIAEENDGWIPVEERFPEEGTYVMCCFDDGAVDVLWQNWQEDKSLLFYADINDEIRKVIAWQPLPEAYHPKQAPAAEYIMSRFVKVE